METLLIKRKDVRSLLSIEECIPAVEEAFRLRALGRAQPPGILGVYASNGGFHIKAGTLNMGRDYFVAKVNANFPKNLKRNGLPTIQGVIVVNDAQTGKLLALIDSIEITTIRTGAATAVAAKYLSNEDATSATICGCGNQGVISLKALKAVRDIRHVFAYDIDEKVAKKFATNMNREAGIPVEVTSNLKRALQESDVCVTCTPSESFFILKNDVRPGTFIAAVGSDNEDKRELEPALLGSAKVVVDSIEQAITIGEVHHAVAEGAMKREHVHGELGEIIAGIKPGRLVKDEVVIFDSTGTALQDIAAASIVLEKAMEQGMGLKFDLAE